jgi:hypothetical protein
MAVAEREEPMPRLAKDGLGWRFSPAEAPVTITFSRIVERSSELTAELHVQSAGRGEVTHILRRRVNLLGTTTPKTLANDLDLATDGAGWPWRRIVEQAFGSVIEAHRSGDEVRLLGGKREAPPSPSHLIEGLLIANVANTWFGPGGTGKSTAGVAACVAHALGERFAGVPVLPGTPLYLDWEDEDEAFERILWEVSRGYGLDESVRVHWRRMKAPLAGDLAYVSALIDRIGATLVVIDSATRAMGAAGDHGTYESTAVAFAEAIRALGKVTTLIIDHVDGATVKEGGVAKKAYGSIHKLNFVRNAWSLTLDDEATTQTVGWSHAKVNHGPKRGEFGIRYERDPVLGGLSLVPVAAEEVSPIAERMTLAARIASALGRSGAMSVRDIAEAVLGATDKKDTETIRKTLNRDMGKRFRTYSDGTWSLKDWRPDMPAGRPDIRLVNAATDDIEPLPF